MEVPTSREELEKEYDNLSRKLETLGLSPYEARAYIALVAHGYGTAEEISKTANLPRTSAYRVLQGLKERGFALATEGRPVIFKPEDPQRVHERVREDIDDLFGKLSLLHEIVREKGIPQLIYTITGKTRVLEKIGELLDKSSETFMISTPALREIRENLDRQMRNALTRGVKIIIITHPNQRVPDGMEVVRRKNLLATDVICDHQEALLAAPDLAACGYTDNAILAEHMERFLEMMSTAGS